MKSSRMMAVLALFCFLFSGASWVWAENPSKYSIGDGKELLVHFDANGKIIKGEFEGSVIKPREIRTLNISIEGIKNPFLVKDIPPGTVIYTGPGDTCVWVFDGYRYVYKCYP